MYSNLEEEEDYLLALGLSLSEQEKNHNDSENKLGQLSILSDDNNKHQETYDEGSFDKEEIDLALALSESSEMVSRNGSSKKKNTHINKSNNSLNLTPKESVSKKRKRQYNPHFKQINSLNFSKNITNNKKLSESQIKSLEWAKYLLFSALTGSDTLLSGDAKGNHITYNNIKHISDTLCLNIEDIDIVHMLLFNSKGKFCEHKQEVSSILCEECWLQETNNKQFNDSKESFLSSIYCDFNQFSSIFNMSSLRVEKNGHVW